MATRDELDIPLPAMTPSYRVGKRRGQPMDPATRRLAVFAGLIGGSLLLLVGVWSFTGHRQGGVPVIQADSRPLRVKPANPGGLQVDGANDPLVSGGAEAKQSAAPLPETPAPQALKAEQQAVTPPAPPPAPPVAVVQEATPTPPIAPASPPVARAEVAPQPLPPQPPPRPRATAAVVKPPAPLVSTPSLLASAATSRSAPASNAALVQLAALDSETAAMSEWQRLSHKYPDLLGGRRPTIMKTEHGGKTFWRLRTGGFGDVAQATVFCERVKAKGGGCSIASF